MKYLEENVLQGYVNKITQATKLTYDKVFRLPNYLMIQLLIYGDGKDTRLPDEEVTRLSDNEYFNYK